MKRLTFLENEKWVLKQENCVTRASKNEELAQYAIDRLAAYEDTGLEPQEVSGLCKMDKRSRMAQMLRWEQAEAEGRLVVLPCKVGTHLWRVTHPYRKEPKATEYVVKNFRTVGKKHVVQLEVQAIGVPVTNWMEYKSFFTTREEAEEALRRKTDERT